MNKLFLTVLLSALVVSTLSYDSLTAATRAGSLVGQSRGNYVCNQVVNYALNGNKNGPLAKDYLNYGSRVQTPRAGDVVVGNDGKHVGMFTSGNNFVHSSVSKYQVINANQNQLKYVFPNGYQIRRK